MQMELYETGMYFYISIAFAAIIPYLICSINPAIIAARLKNGKQGKDIREMGSGNPGLTNTLRTMGKGAAAFVLLFDVLKGVISILATEAVYWSFIPETPVFSSYSYSSPAYEQLIVVWIAALAAVIGHCYPLYYKFKGGKAILVTVSALFVIDWVSALILLSLFIIIVFFTRYVSLGSVVAAALSPLCVYFTGTYLHKTPYMIAALPFIILMAGIIVFKHRGNIKRLLNGTEKKLGKKE